MSLSSTQLQRLKRQAIFEGETVPKTRHLRPPDELTGNMTLWSTRCGLKWPDRRWFQVVGFLDSDSPQVQWCEACLAQAGIRLAPHSDELYEQAVREWIVRRIPSHMRTVRIAKADDVMDVRFGVDYGFTGSDVTPADEPWPSVHFKLRTAPTKELEVFLGASPVEVVVECLRIVEELRLQPV